LLVTFQNTLDDVYKTIKDAEKQVEMAFEPLFILLAFP